MTSQNSQPIISEYLQYLTDLLTSGSSRGKFSTTHLGRISCSKPLGLWSGIFFMWVEIEDRKESMLKRELNTTTSETRLQEQNQYKESQGVGLFRISENRQHWREFNKTRLTLDPPGQHLVVPVLKISLLIFADWVKQLVFMEVQDLFQVGQIGSEGHQLTQVQNWAAEKNSAKKNQNKKMDFTGQDYAEQETRTLGWHRLRLTCMWNI